MEASEIKIAQRLHSEYDTPFKLADSTSKSDGKLVKVPQVSANLSLNATTPMPVAPYAPKCSPLDVHPFEAHIARKPKSTTSKIAS